MAAFTPVFLPNTCSFVFFSKIFAKRFPCPQPGQGSGMLTSVLPPSRSLAEWETSVRVDTHPLIGTVERRLCFGPQDGQ